MMKFMEAEPQDAEALLNIYAPYVTNTAVTFEYEIPSLHEFQKRIADISANYPYIKAVDEEGMIAGYAYAAAFKDRAAYDWSVETTIYLDMTKKKRGTGRLLYSALEKALKEMGILNMNACIALPHEEDRYLNRDSVLFHEKMGFRPVGIFHDSGFKFDTWYDMIWMEKMIGVHGNASSVRFGKWNREALNEQQ